MIELISSIPAALFDSSGLMNTAVKSQLGKILMWADRMASDASDDGVHYVIDGGSLLHIFKWPQGSRYEYICEMYDTYLVKKNILQAQWFSMDITTFQQHKILRISKDADLLHKI